MGVRGFRDVMAIAVAATAAGSLAMHAPAAAGLSLPAHPPANAFCTPTTLNFPGPTNITCTLQIQTYPREERFTVSAGSPQFAGPDFVGAGSALAVRSRIQLTGPGTVHTIGSVIGDPGQCSTLTPGLHGAFGEGGGSLSVTIPPNTTTTFTAEFQTTDPPWPGTSLAPSFTLSPDMPPGMTSTVSQRLPFVAPEPNRTGVSGVQINLDTKPSSPVWGRVGTPTVKVGKRLKVFGSTSPALNRQKLKILTRYHGPKGTKSQPAKSVKVKTNRAGRFSYKGWVLDKPGLHEVAVKYGSQRPFLADDYTCSHSIEAGK